MAQFYTLEEAARVLGMSPEELKSKAQHREIRAFLDGGSWRFRVSISMNWPAAGAGQRRRAAALRPGGSRGPMARTLKTSTSPSSSLAWPSPTWPTRLWTRFSTQPPRSNRREVRLLGRPRHPLRRSVGASQPGDRVELGDHRHAVQRQVAQRLRRSSCAGQRQGVRAIPTSVSASPEPDLKAPSDSDVTLIKDDTSDHHFLTPASRRRRHGRTELAHGRLVGRGPGRRVRQRFRAQSLERSGQRLQPESGSDFELSALDASTTNSSRPRYVPAIPT